MITTVHFTQPDLSGDAKRAWANWWAPALCRVVLDSDGRPRRLRRMQAL